MSGLAELQLGGIAYMIGVVFFKVIDLSDVDPDPVESAFILVRGFGSGGKKRHSIMKKDH